MTTDYFSPVPIDSRKMILFLVYSRARNLEARRRITVSKYNVSDKIRYYIIIYFPLEMIIQKAF